VDRSLHRNQARRDTPTGLGADVPELTLRGAVFLVPLVALALLLAARLILALERRIRRRHAHARAFKDASKD